MSSNVTIALLGQPNSGKSTIFNGLTGMHQHVGNWPGKTVEKKEGSFFHNGKEYILADLPGSYSLSANSDEEVITRDFISSGEADIVCILADSSQLERSLFMTADYAGIKVPCFLVLNMADVATSQGRKVDTAVLEKKLGIPVIWITAADKKSYGPFFETLEKAIEEKSILDYSLLEKHYGQVEGYAQAKALIPEDIIPGCSSDWLAAKAIEGDIWHSQ